MLRQCIKMGVSDITIQSGDYIWCEIKRKHTAVTDRTLEHSEVERALRFLYNSSGPSMLANAEAIDFEVATGAEANNMDHVKRFRANATACRVGAISRGLSMPLHTIPGVPPDLDRSEERHEGKEVVGRLRLR